MFIVWYVSLYLIGMIANILQIQIRTQLFSNLRTLFATEEWTFLMWRVYTFLLIGTTRPLSILQLFHTSQKENPSLWDIFAKLIPYLANKMSESAHSPAPIHQFYSLHISQVSPHFFQPILLKIDATFGNRHNSSKRVNRCIKQDSVHFHDYFTSDVTQIMLNME